MKLSFTDSVRHIRSLLDSCEFETALETAHESAKSLEPHRERELRIIAIWLGKSHFAKEIMQPPFTIFRQPKPPTANTLA